MKISVIVPVYNAVTTIGKLIDTVINQTYQNYELILVDDGSKDNSIEKMIYYSKTNSKIKVFSKDNTGPGLTRKYGFEKSSGDLVFFVDSDDWLHNNKVFEKINDIFINNSIDILFFNREEIITKDIIKYKQFQNTTPGLHNIKEINDKIEAGLGSKVFKRDILNKTMFIESNVYEDLYTTFLYLDNCTTLYYLDSTLYTIYHSGEKNTLSYIKKSERIKKSIDIVLNIYQQLKTNSLRYGISLYMAKIFIIFCVDFLKGKKYTKDKQIKEKVRQIKEILLKEKTNIYPQKKIFIKRLIYKLMLKLYI